MKKIIKLCLLFMVVLSLTGCFKRDTYENIKIYTTVYPVEFITQKLYGDHSKINSIYPAGVDVSSYVITNKKINDYSKGDLFIYNGLSSEKDLAASLVKKNKKMESIDVSQSIDVKNDVTELWLSPANFLMMTSNIKNGLKNLITHKALLDDIDKNYEELKLKASEIEAELKLVAENANNKRLIVANNAFKFLEKYGFEVISISDDDEKSNTNISQAQKYFTAKSNSYLFVLAGTEETDTIKDLVSKGATKVEVSNMITLTEEERKNECDYFILINDFIEAIKTEVY